MVNNCVVMGISMGIWLRTYPCCQDLNSNISADDEAQDVKGSLPMQHPWAVSSLVRLNRIEVSVCIFFFLENNSRIDFIASIASPVRLSSFIHFFTFFTARSISFSVGHIYSRVGKLKFH